MYYFGRDFDESLGIEDIVRDYIDNKYEETLEDSTYKEELKVQRQVFNVAAEKLIPFVEAAVNAIEAVGILDLKHVSDNELILGAAKDALCACMSFYGQFEQYKEFVRYSKARYYLMEKICTQMTMVEFLYRINCI